MEAIPSLLQSGSRTESLWKKFSRFLNPEIKRVRRLFRLCFPMEPFCTQSDQKRLSKSGVPSAYRALLLADSAQQLRPRPAEPGHMLVAELARSVRPGTGVCEMLATRAKVPISRDIRGDPIVPPHLVRLTLCRRMLRPEPLNALPAVTAVEVSGEYAHAVFIARRTRGNLSVL